MGDYPFTGGNGMSSKMATQQSLFESWLNSLKASDPELYDELTSRLKDRIAAPESVRSPVSGISLESVSHEVGIDVEAIALETIVREGRPAFLIQENRINPTGHLADAAAKLMLKRLMDAAAVVEPRIPLVGRIDVENYPGSLTYLGTGWLVQPDIVVTNRHVAELMAYFDSNKFRFRPGRFGEEMRASLDYRHEKGINATAVARVLRVMWIEPNKKGPDIAFLQVASRTDGTREKYIPLAEKDAKPDSQVAVIGYPARAPAEIIPNQAWMDQIYGSTYDIKRVAPGLMGADSRGWATHDCTTLGGNSGSAVIDLKTGAAVALHFAGLYMIENYAVPASTIRKYLTNPPWNSTQPRRNEMQPVNKTPDPAGQPTPPISAAAREKDASSTPQITSTGVETQVRPGQVVVTIPLTVSVSLGLPQTAEADSTSPTDSLAKPRDIHEAARQLLRDQRVEGVLSVSPGYKIKQGRLTKEDCLVVSARPDLLETVQGAMPHTFGEFPVEVRPASISEQLGIAALTEAPVTSISYNDDDRTGDEFSFDWVDEEMSVLMHVGPERSWTVLSEFLQGAENELVSSIYEFHAEHIARAIEHELADGAEMTLVLARQSRDPASGKIAKGDFDRSETFERWEKKFTFERVFVPLGSQGLVANSYHIKVTVRDGSSFWLSSGNWKRSSQPLIPTAKLNDPKVTGAAGNREWHVVIENDTLANRFRNHIKADFEQSLELGGTPEAVDDEILVDVPDILLEAVEEEAAPAKVIEPREIKRRVRVKPLLTPDKKGAVFSRAVLQLIRSAKKQLLFQNQYIKTASGGFLKQLVDALAKKSTELEDFRIILRSENDALATDLSQLQRAGIDVKEHIRVLSSTHTKGIIVDGKRVLLGSHNWSSSGVTLNRDASLIFDDEEVAQYYAEAFEIDWNRSREPAFEEAVFESVRPAEGDAPPQGFVRMRLSDYLED
jgi:phosphatidylserine/phosphatidylglycerophosphate/cardiolipin synthase-like enzyme/V8-like Glu-specific endopeptidase